MPPQPRSCPTLRPVPFPRPFRGFPWWLPPAAAALAALAAALIIGSAEPLWAADARVWIRDEQLAVEELETLLSEPSALRRALERSLSEMTPNELAAASNVTRNGALLTVTVAAPSGGEAQDLATALAGVAADEAWGRSNSPGTPAEELGIGWPGPRQIAPDGSADVSLAGLAALLGGLAAAALLSRPRAAPAPSSLALLGRRGWRPLAMIPERERSRDGEPPPSAAQLADAIGAALERGRTTAFAPLHDGADAALPALQAARALAGRGLSVLWLDARAEHPLLLALPNDRSDERAAPPTPIAPVDLNAAPLPGWLAGTPAPPWRERMRQLLAANSARFEAIVLVVGSLSDESRSRATAEAADRVVLTARDDFDPADAPSPLPPSPVLGVALTHAPERRAADFQSALEAAREEADRNRAGE